MAKTLDLGIPKPSEKNKQQQRQGANTTKRERGALVDLNFKVSAEFKREFKVWAASHDLTQKQALEYAFKLLKDSRL